MDDKILRRERIENRISELCNFPLSCIYGSSGSGKTTAVKEYMVRSCVQYLYIPLRKSDTDKERFWNKICFYVSKKNSKLGMILQNIGFPEDIVWVARLISGIKDYVKKDYIVIFDDFQNIEQASDIVELIEYIALEESDIFKVMLISRNLPPEQIARLCATMDNNELMFTVDEISSYCGIVGINADEHSLKRIFELSEGWFAIIYVICLSLKTGGDIFASVFLDANAQIIVDRTLESQFTEQELYVLTILSVPEEIPSELAGLITKNNEAVQLLKRLALTYKFISYSPEQDRYFIHSVFRHYLLRRHRVSSEEINNVMYLTGKWCLDHGDSINAIDYCYRSGKIKSFLKEINRPGIKKLNMRSSDLFFKIMSNLDISECIDCPFPYLFMILCCVLSGNKDKKILGHKLLEFMENNIDEYDESIKNKILGEIYVIHIFIVFNDIEKMRFYSNKAYGLLGGRSELISTDDPITMGLPDAMYVFLRKKGGMNDLTEYSYQIYCNLSDNGFVYGMYPLLKAINMLEQCEFEKASEYAMKAKYIGKEKKQVVMIACAQLVLIRIELAEGNNKKAIMMLSELAGYSGYCEPYSVQASAYKMQCELAEAYVYCCLNMTNQIENWIIDGGTYSKPLFLNGMGYHFIIRARASLFKNDIIFSEVLCGIAEREISSLHNHIGMLHCGIIRAIIAERKNENGIKILEQTLMDAAEDNIVLLIAEYGKLIKPLLIRLMYTNKSEYIKKINLQCEKYCKTESENSVSLTERETQVLKLMLSGLSRNDVALKLNVSISTVKRHIEMCYRKLGVNNRISAINEAKKQGLI